ncbi:hypothetical protein BO94DRAFT_70020 [Aspergillus sclerotioniger CBS 115572]|uniref:Uncharacterized protein n=1 Tax=Aspergillus sclerotioniger CBS 115572 TaxID=1450535 RepID=A0A317WSM3_9EURO|nr:hypothetical protein BO94DRAFT_70020 [Aspergillus sclerotioniger CBS 115572]PWY87200.1 hypothetical protein BO94DRAFT_70020 [Aspergillus sclerotioniger CBS 115572]
MIGMIGTGEGESLVGMCSRRCRGEEAAMTDWQGSDGRHLIPGHTLRAVCLLCSRRQLVASSLQSIQFVPSFVSLPIQGASSSLPKVFLETQTADRAHLICHANFTAPPPASSKKCSIKCLEIRHAVTFFSDSQLHERKSSAQRQESALGPESWAQLRS